MSDGLAEPVVVIGANGFVGRRVIQALAATPGLRPIAAQRRGPRDKSDIETRLCEATDAASVAAALAGAGAVVNCVAGTADTMLAATRHICEAGRGKLRRVVQLSSMAVYGNATGLVGETHPLAGQGWYGEAKVQSEGLVAAYVAAGGDAVILRPGCIHGPGSEPWTGRIARLLRSHRLGDLGAAGDGGCNLIAVDDVAAAAVAALQRPGLAGAAFNLADPDPGSWNRYFIALARAIGATPVRRITGRWLRIESKLAIPLKIGEIVAAKARLGRRLPDPLPGSLLALFRQDIQLDHRAADAALGFPRTPPDETIAAAAAWFKGRE